MKVKTSITLSEELLQAIDERARQYKGTRSELIEAAVSAFIKQLVRSEQNARDLAIINRRAEFLNIALDIPDQKMIVTASPHRRVRACKGSGGALSG